MVQEILVREDQVVQEVQVDQEDQEDQVEIHLVDSDLLEIQVRIYL